VAALGADTDWPDHLPWVLLNIRSAPKLDSNISAVELVFGSCLTLPAQPAAPVAPAVPAETPPAEVEQQRAEQVIPTRPAARPLPDKMPALLAHATMVYMRKGAKGPLVLPYSGLYKVLRKGPKVFHIEVGDVEQIVTVDRLKPHTGAATAAPTAPATSRDQSPELPAITNARPTRERRWPEKLDL
jgi:hypothetical protein